MATSSQNSERRKLAEALVAVGFIDLFQRETYSALDRFWNAPHGPEDLKALAESPASPRAAAFLAAEILYQKGGYTAPPEAVASLASAYAAALDENVTRMANPWGMPGTLDGVVGQHLVELGEAAVPLLIRLLDEDKAMIYAGSREAGLGNQYRYRVKDAAAFFIATIRKRPWTVKKAPRQRDVAIRQLKAELAKEDHDCGRR